MFTLQDQIATEIGAALALTTDAAAAVHRSPCEGDNAEAYRAYLTGRYLLSRVGADRMPDAFAALRRAIQLDPACARAHAGLASLYVSQALTADADPRVVFPLARAAVARALAIDPASAEAYEARGRIQAWSDWNWSLAAVSFRRALALDPGRPRRGWPTARRSRRLAAWPKPPSRCGAQANWTRCRPRST